MEGCVIETFFYQRDVGWKPGTLHETFTEIRLDELDLRVRIDAQAAVEHAREAGKLGEDENPRGQGSHMSRRDELERVDIDRLVEVDIDVLMY